MVVKEIVGGRDTLVPVGLAAPSCRMELDAVAAIVLDAADLVEKSEADGRKLQRASNFSRSLLGGGRARFAWRHESRTAYAQTSSHHPLSGEHG